MKKLLTLALALLAGAGTAQAQLTATGGPDNYGYTWKTSAAPGGPTYRWVDITTRGQQILGLDDDNLSAQFTLPFSFPFYLASFNKMKIGSNGYLIFNPLAAAGLSQPLPLIPTADNTNKAFVAGYLSDLNFSGALAANAGRCYYYANADSVVVSYINVPFWERAVGTGPDFRGSNTFQMILLRADGSVVYQYQSLDPTQPAPATQSPNQVVIGIEDYTETLGLQAGLNTLPANNSAIKFYRPTSTSLLFTDVTPAWFNNADNGAFFTLLNQPVNVTAQLSNLGNQPSAPTTIQVRVTNRPGLSAAALYSDRDTLVVNGGRDTTVTLAPYTPTTASPSAGTGVFQVQSRVFEPGGGNTTNDINRTMLVVVDTASALPRPQRQFTLSYDDEVPNNAVGFGAGVYFKPPYYPTEIRSTDAFIAGALNTATSPFVVNIFADNGPNGSPGTLLYTDTVAQADVVVGALNTLILPQPVAISTGGFYISWIAPNGDSTFVASHGPASPNQAIPVSRRSYEVINGVFAPYRTTDENIAITATMGTYLTVTGTAADRTGLVLQPAYPNPANDQVTLTWSQPQAAAASMTVTDLVGRPVRTLAFGAQAAGDHQFNVSVADLPAGLYMYTLQVGNAKLTRKLVVQ